MMAFVTTIVELLNIATDMAYDMRIDVRLKNIREHFSEDDTAVIAELLIDYYKLLQCKLRTHIMTLNIEQIRLLARKHRIPEQVYINYISRNIACKTMQAIVLLMT